MDEDFRIKPCEHCQSEGRILRCGWYVWEEVDCGECPVCEGTGMEMIETEPVEEQEIMQP